MNTKEEDPLFLSVLLSCISSLFVVVTITPGALHPTLSCIFKCITFVGPAKENQENSVRILRRHGCALMVKIATRYPSTLVPVFDYLRQTIVEDLFIKTKILHKMEFVTLIEGLVLISNEFQNFAAQSRFIEDLAKPICDQLKNLEVHFPNFFLGLDSACQESRAELAFCLNFLAALFRRVSVPGDLLKCRHSGFIDTSVNEVLAIKSPAGNVGCHILETILKLLKTFIGQFGKSNAFEMLDFEKSMVQGQSNEDHSADPEKNNQNLKQGDLFESNFNPQS